MRLAFARIYQETNAISPVPTDEAAFRRFLCEGDELGRRCAATRAEVPAVWWNAELSGFCRRAVALGAAVEPLFSVFAIPGGKVAREVYERYKDRLLDGLSPGFDGVYLCLHGAMGVVGLDDADGDLLQAVRAEVGPGVPVVTSFDLHGFLTPARVAAVDALVGYRTYPHRDQARIGRECAELLVRLVRRELRPSAAWRSLPMVLGGSPSVDLLAPMRAVFRGLARIRRHPKVLTATLLTCQPWHDAPMLGWSAYVLTDGEPALAEQLAEQLADLAWSVRDHLPPEVTTVAQALESAQRAWVRRAFGTVCLADCSDAVGAGGVGENTAVLRALLAHGGGLRAYIPVRDAEVADRLWDVPVGRAVEVDVGGKLAPAWYEPLALSGVLTARHETVLGGRSVRVRAGSVEVVVTADAPVCIGPAFYRDVGLSPWRADVCVVKSWIGFRWHYLPHNRLSVWGRTRGVTDLDAMQDVAYDVPVHPFVALADWRDADRRRRLRDTGVVIGAVDRDL